MRVSTFASWFVPCALFAVACGSTHGDGFDPGSGQSVADSGSTGDPTDAGGSKGQFSNDGSSGDSGAAVDPHTPVDVIATADNAYAFGWGDANSTTTYIANPPAAVAGDIFNCPVGGPARKGAPLATGTTVGPEAYEVPADQAPPGAYLYLVTWADYLTTQGVIGTFKRQGGSVVTTGAGEWQGCATGIPYDTSNAVTSAGPTQSTVNEQIAVCNAGSGSPTTTSAGWVGPTGPIASTPHAVGHLAFGQDNGWTTDARNDGGDFQPTCGEPSYKDPDNGGIDPTAKWMWYAPPGSTADPFVATGTNTTRTFLIFRLSAAAVPGAPR